MYVHLCGTDTRVPWLGSDHCGMEFLKNVSKTPYVSVTKGQHDQLLSMTKIGIENMDKAGVRLIPELRQRTNVEAVKNAHKNRITKLEHFTKAFKTKHDKDDAKKKAVKHRGRKTTAVMNAWRDRSVEIRNILSVLAGANVTAEKS